MVTTIVTDQKMSETTPNTFWLDTGTGCGSDGLKTVCTVYSGLVPISPNTTPRAPTASAACALPRLIALPSATLTLAGCQEQFMPRTRSAADQPTARHQPPRRCPPCGRVSGRLAGFVNYAGDFGQRGQSRYHPH